MIGEVPIGRAVTRAIVAALCVAAGMACIALLRGDFDETDWKVIATSLLFALVSAMAGAGLAVRPSHPELGSATFGASLAAFVLVVADRLERARSGAPPCARSARGCGGWPRPRSSPRPRR